MTNILSIPRTIEERVQRQREGRWVPACGGTEEPFMTRTGKRLQYMWNTGTGEHAYIDCETDIILTAEQADYAMGVM